MNLLLPSLIAAFRATWDMHSIPTSVTYHSLRLRQINDLKVLQCNLYVDTNSNIQYTQAIVVFSFNTADYTGGAIQIIDKNPDNPACPLNRLLSPEINDSGIIFISNYAKSGGYDIYGGNLDEAIVFQNLLRCIELVNQSTTHVFPSLSSISSKPSRVCLCNIESEPIPECLKVFDSREAYPGEDITLSVVAVGQNFGTSGGFVNAQLATSL